MGFWSCYSATQRPPIYILNVYVYVYICIYNVHTAYNTYIYKFIYYTSYSSSFFPWIKSKSLIISLMTFLILISNNFPSIICINLLCTGFAYATWVVCNSLNPFIDFQIFTLLFRQFHLPGMTSSCLWASLLPFKCTFNCCSFWTFAWAPIWLTSPSTEFWSPFLLLQDLDDVTYILHIFNFLYKIQVPWWSNMA